MGLLPWSDYTDVWLTWWVGDGVGVILLSPQLLTLASWWGKRWLDAFHWREFCGFALTLAIVTSLSLELVVVANLPLPLFIVLPVLLWSAFRFPPHVTILAAVIVAAAAIYITSMGAGPFQAANLNQSLIELQLFLCTVLITILLVLGIVSERRQLSVRMEKISRKHMHMLDRTLGGVIVADRQGRIESFNQSAGLIFGYTADELLGRNINFLVPKSFRESHYRFIDHPQEQGAAAIFGKKREVLGCHKDGHSIPLLISVSSSLDEEAGHFLVVLQDLSETKRLQVACQLHEQTFEFLVQSGFDALLVLNNNTIVNLNQRFVDLFGYGANELLGQPLKVKLFTTDLVFIEGHGQALESEGITNHGRRFPVAVQQRSAKLGDVVVKIISVRCNFSNE